MTDLAMCIKGSKQSGVNFLANSPVSIGVTVDGVGPINSGERVFGAAIRICHGQERGKVMLLGVAFVVAITGDLEFPPEGSVLDDEETWQCERAKNWDPTRNEGGEGDGVVDRDDSSVATDITEQVVVSIGSCVLEWIFWASGRLSGNVSMTTRVFVLQYITARGLAVILQTLVEEGLVVMVKMVTADVDGDGGPLD
ncbi:hypothetical protein LR48_Vigan08g008700 [Vigna angularis]|uniref:Uncharacterized protein n=1 Tax=Phaseolus angularis TaxID=3914 RepID=A0A0L9V2A5_PHAAN|nr:hypothetical protein LR48_Vigan08g008700 [Vigna angularis]